MIPVSPRRATPPGTRWVGVKVQEGVGRIHDWFGGRGERLFNGLGRIGQRCHDAEATFRRHEPDRVPHRPLNKDGEDFGK